VLQAKRTNMGNNSGAVQVPLMDDLWADGKWEKQKFIQTTIEGGRLIQAVDLFCGGGGATHGFTQAGVQVVLAVDSWNEALEVHKLNHPDVETACFELGGSIIETAAFIRSKLTHGAHFHLHGSPPCQNLSNAGKKDRGEGLRLVEWFLKLVEYMNPDSWSMENVHPLRRWLDENDVPFVIVNAADYGVPQTRKRVFAGEGWLLEPSHVKEDWVSIIDALPHLNGELIEIVNPKIRKRTVHEPIRTITSKTSSQTKIKINTNGCTESMSKRARSTDTSIDKPCKTLTRQIPTLRKVNGEATKLRALTIEETATLQGWEGFKVPEGIKKGDLWMIVGNMVSPPVAEAIGRGLI